MTILNDEKPLIRQSIDPEFEQTIFDFYVNLLESQQILEPQIDQFFSENIWELLE